MSRHGCSRNRPQVVTTGVLFILSGVALWAGARGWYALRDVWAWWPLAFVFPAAHELAAPPPERRVFAGLAWLALAAVLVAANLGRLRLANTLAVVFVIGGLRLVYVAWLRGRES